MLATFPIFQLIHLNQSTLEIRFEIMSLETFDEKWYLIFECPGTSCIHINRSRTMQDATWGNLLSFAYLGLAGLFSIFSTDNREFN